jgi:hypothetical protein
MNNIVDKKGSNIVNVHLKNNHYFTSIINKDKKEIVFFDPYGMVDKPTL